MALLAKIANGRLGLTLPQRPSMALHSLTVVPNSCWVLDPRRLRPRLPMAYWAQHPQR